MAVCPEPKQDVGGEVSLTAALLVPKLVPQKKPAVILSCTVICMHGKLEGNISWYYLPLLDLHDTFPVEPFTCQTFHLGLNLQFCDPGELHTYNKGIVVPKINCLLLVTY